MKYQRLWAIIRWRIFYLTWVWNGTGTWHQNGQTDGKTDN